jgi:hypothetical protein
MKFKRRTHSKAQTMKTKFRRSSRWLKFRRYMKATQKTDPITGSPLSPTFSVHHCDLREEHYEDVSDSERFIGLNPQTHETVHFLYQAHCGWRSAVMNLIRILKRMDRCSND